MIVEKLTKPQYRL